jgi:hypothetical protein
VLLLENSLHHARAYTKFPAYLGDTGGNGGFVHLR